jgi:hypothetical protein
MVPNDVITRKKISLYHGQRQVGLEHIPAQNAPRSIFHVADRTLDRGSRKPATGTSTTKKCIVICNMCFEELLFQVLQ